MLEGGKLQPAENWILHAPPSADGSSLIQTSGAHSPRIAPPHQTPRRICKPLLYFAKHSPVQLPVRF